MGPHTLTVEFTDGTSVSDVFFANDLLEKARGETETAGATPHSASAYLPWMVLLLVVVMIPVYLGGLVIFFVAGVAVTGHFRKTQNQPYVMVDWHTDELLKFKNLFDRNVITQEEFDAKKKQLLGV